jgi:ABC-type bacteriocin/lantibiotic exporters, contain an N-terminal double-glycine peptidase domain
VLYYIEKKKGGSIFHIADPGVGILSYNEHDFIEAWCTTKAEKEVKGVVLVVERKASVKLEEVKEGKSQFSILVPYFLKYKRYFALLLIGLLIGSLIQLFFPFLTQSIVDVGIKDSNLRFINTILIAQLILLFSKTIAEFIQNWLLLHISTRVNISMLSDFIIKLMKLPMGFFDTKLTGDILQRFADHKRLEKFITIQLLNVLYAGLNFVVFGSILWYFDFSIFLLFLVGSLLYIGWLLLFMRKRRIIDYQMFDQQALNDSRTYQLIQGMQEIKLQGCSHRMRWDWEDIQAKQFEINIAALKLRQTQTVGTVFINETKNVLITFMAAYAVVHGTLSIGMMLAIQYIIGQLSIPVEQIAQFIYNMQDTKISLERIVSTTTKDDENRGRTLQKFTGETELISIDNLSFSYEGSLHPTLKHIDMTIPRGTTTAIVGASGSGKTTLIKLLLQYYRIQSGSIMVDTYNLNDIDTDYWRQQCGAVMQDGYIFSETIALNIALSEDTIDIDRLAYAAKMANLDEFVNQLPLKYNTVIGQEGRGLSQGQKQRILIARAIYKMPQFLFLDEATNALDATNEKEITDNLTAFMRERTVFIVAHRLSTVMAADQIVVLRQGEIIEMGTHLELVEKQGYYYNLIKNQLELGN